MLVFDNSFIENRSGICIRTKKAQKLSLVVYVIGQSLASAQSIRADVREEPAGCACRSDSREASS